VTTPAPASDATGPLAIGLNHTASRFEGRVGDELVGVVEFVLRDTVMVVTHTGTEPAWRGRGIAAELTRFALDDARTQGRRVTSICPYTASYIADRAEYHDLLA
jgi:predicted GNAT family acetyltransferase